MKNATDELYSRLNMTENRISKLEDTSTETSKTKKQRQNNDQKKIEQIIQELWETTKGTIYT